MKNWLAVAMVCVSASTVRAEIGPPTDVAAHSRGAGKVVVARVANVHSTLRPTGSATS